MITNGEVTVNRRRRAGDHEHNDVTVKLSFTMEGIPNEEEFRCRIVDEAVTLANRGLQSTPSAACAADTSSKDHAPETTAASRRPRSTPAATVEGPPTAPPISASPSSSSAALAPEPVVLGSVPTGSLITAVAPDGITYVPPTPPAAVPIAPVPAPGGAVSNGVNALPSIPPNGGTRGEPIVIGLPPSPQISVAASQVEYPNPTVPAPAAVASSTAAPASSDVAGGGRYADKGEFQKALVAQVTRINGLRPGQGGLLVNQVIARYVDPPNGAGAIPVERREAFMADVEAVV